MFTHVAVIEQVDHMFSPNHWDSFCSAFGRDVNCAGLLLVRILSVICGPQPVSTRTKAVSVGLSQADNALTKQCRCSSSIQRFVVCTSVREFDVKMFGWVGTSTLANSVSLFSDRYVQCMHCRSKRIECF